MILVSGGRGSIMDCSLICRHVKEGIREVLECWFLVRTAICQEDGREYRRVHGWERNYSETETGDIRLWRPSGCSIGLQAYISPPIHLILLVPKVFFRRFGRRRGTKFRWWQPCGQNQGWSLDLEFWQARNLWHSLPDENCRSSYTPMCFIRTRAYGDRRDWKEFSERVAS